MLDIILFWLKKEPIKQISSSQFIHYGSGSISHSVVSNSLQPMDYSPPGSSVHGILQARILEWVAVSSSRGSAQPRDWTHVSRIADKFFTVWATRDDHSS